MRRTHFLQSIFAAAALAAPLLAAADPRYAVTVVAGAGSTASGIHNLGQVVGSLDAGAAYHGFVYAGGVLTELGTLGGPFSAVTSINDLGQVVGHLGVDSLPGNPGDIYPRSAFLYENGKMHLLEGVPADWSSGANDIDKLGQVVGWASGADAGFAFLYQDGEMIDLNTLIDPASGWTITGANAINDVQQIAANACRAGMCQAVRLDLVSAVPEPPVFALLAAGLALGLARGKRFRLPVRHRPG